MNFEKRGAASNSICCGPRISRKPALLLPLLAIAALAALCCSARAEVPAQGDEEFRLYPGVAPGSEGQTQQEVSDGQRIRNVTVPTLTLFRPAQGRASDLAVIIAPGGGFQHLSIANEGYDVARNLAAHGITALVLKYRLSESPSPGKANPPAAISDPAAAVKARDANNGSPAAHRAMADGENAVRFVKAHAKAWNIAPQHVGFIGFSAGAVIALHLAITGDAEARPDFVAAIYGPLPPGAVIPADAPPLFLAVAADDRLVGPAGVLPVFDRWRAAGHDAELHIFEAGDHGFGMKRQNKTSDHWIDEYLWWLEARGLLPGQRAEN
jgi:acetyl esterase/lipase